MEIYADGHYHFSTEYNGHKFFMQNPDGIIYMDKDIIAYWVDGEFVDTDGNNYGWCAFDTFVEQYVGVHS